MNSVHTIRFVHHVSDDCWSAVYEVDEDEDNDGLFYLMLDNVESHNVNLIDVRTWSTLCEYALYTNVIANFNLMGTIFSSIRIR